MGQQEEISGRPLLWRKGRKEEVSKDKTVEKSMKRFATRRQCGWQSVKQNSTVAEVTVVQRASLQGE